MLIGEIVCKSGIRAELLEAYLTLGAGPVRIHHAADGGEVTRLEIGYCGTNLGDAAHNLVSGDARVDGGHETAPLVADLVEVGVTDAAEENFDLHVVRCWVASSDRGGGQRRCRTGSGVCFSVVHALNLDARQLLRYA
jgi:hypothetical protein